MVIENAFCALGVSDAHGVIESIFDKKGNLELILEPRLAGNFVLLVPFGDTQANYIDGKVQRLSFAEVSGRGAVLRWDGPLSNPKGSYDIDVSMEIELADSAIVFHITVHNRSPLAVAEVWHPVFGGLRGILRREETKVMIPLSGYPGSPGLYEDLFRRFRGAGVDGLGTTGPEHLFGYPGKLPMPWYDIYNPKVGRGVYCGCHDTAARFKVLRFELLPGTASGRADSWPSDDEVDRSVPVGVTSSWVSFPYLKQGETFSGAPVHLEFHEGGWHRGASIYREWFLSKFPVVDPENDWLHRTTSYQVTALLSPEGDYTCGYTHIPKLAEDALRHGVRTIFIGGWDRGGQDSHYPMYEPDERLGTWDDLRDAIERCHSLGVRVVMFVNFQPIDCNTEWYQRELKSYRSMNPWGNSIMRSWGWGTVGARILATSRPMVFGDLAFEGFRKTIVTQMVKLAEAGADGIHVDKLAWDIVTLDFNPALESGPDRATWEGILKTVEEVLAACRNVKADFSLSYEGLWDRMLEHTGVLWAWHSPWEPDRYAACRYAFRQFIPCMSVLQPFDYRAVNSAVRFGYQIFIGPNHFRKSMSEESMKPLSAYIREVNRIRETLFGTVFLGEFLDAFETDVRQSGHIEFSTHRNMKTLKRACVLVNCGEEPGRATVSFYGNTGGEAKVFRPFTAEEAVRMPVRVVVPPERFAIVVEK
jgi:hypothetical protein